MRISVVRATAATAPVRPHWAQSFEKAARPAATAITKQTGPKISPDQYGD
jgi:hypothetical protein